MTVTAINMPNYKLKLSSKKLQSGKFQVKFYASQYEPFKAIANRLPSNTDAEDAQDLYGYVLVDAKDTLKQVVNTINQRLHLMEEANDYYHTHLFAVRKEPIPSSEFMIFKS